MNDKKQVKGNVVSHPGVNASCCTLSIHSCTVQSQTAGPDALFRCCLNIFCVLIFVTVMQKATLTRTGWCCCCPRSSLGKEDLGLTSSCAGVTVAGQDAGAPREHLPLSVMVCKQAEVYFTGAASCSAVCGMLRTSADET